jgi:hypothetical protein
MDEEEEIDWIDIAQQCEEEAEEEAAEAAATSAAHDADQAGLSEQRKGAHDNQQQVDSPSLSLIVCDLHFRNHAGRCKLHCCRALKYLI